MMDALPHGHETYAYPMHDLNHKSIDLAQHRSILHLLNLPHLLHPLIIITNA